MATIIDPSGIFGLTAKYKKALEQGKIGALRLEFSNGEFTATAAKNDGPKGALGNFVPLSEAMASISATADRPYGDEKAHLVGKYEVRLDEECPVALRDAADKAALDAAVAALPFRKRRALQMSNKEFELAFSRWENGAPVPRTAEAVEALLAERNATRGGGNRGRGRGRGGRGRGSFRDAPKAQESRESAKKTAGNVPQ